ncbi:MAG: cohesin domain-containing protein, partial [Gammaproteobacteria bacterium]
MMKNGFGFLAAAALCCGSAQAATLQFSPASRTIAPGASADVAIVVSGLGAGAAPSLGAYDFNVTYDAGILSLGAITFGDPSLGSQLALSTPSFRQTDTAVAGIARLVEVSLDSISIVDAQQAGQFTLAVLSFDALTPGVSSLGFDTVTIGDAAANALPATL